jgi:trehalose 6-phosphate phosphatase
VGNHGFEIETPRGQEIVFYGPDDVRRMEEIRDQLTWDSASIPGARVEMKGPVVAMHYRLVPEERVPEVEEAVTRVLSAHLDQVQFARGKKVFEARLKKPVNKGTAVRRILQEAPDGAFIIYFGDDLTDLDAYREIRGWGLRVHVGGESPEADYLLPDTSTVAGALEHLRTLLRPEEEGADLKSIPRGRASSR